MKKMLAGFAFLAAAAIAQAPVVTTIEIKITTQDSARGQEIRRELERTMRGLGMWLNAGTITTEYQLGQEPPVHTDVTVWRPVQR